MIWETCQGAAQIRPIAATLYRLVESQEQVATLSFVDTLEEQALLETLLETVKPNYPLSLAENAVNGLHYLLKTPFRYPPLKWGSRFGRSHENSLFYGGLSLDVTLAEAAYYRFVFWHSMDVAPIKNKMRSEHSVFSVDYATEKGIQLHAPPFDAFHSLLTHPQDYLATQQLGTCMRAAHVDVFEYTSARDANNGQCVALFNANPFQQTKPKDSHQWLCELSANEVLFKQVGQARIYRFELASFLHDEKFPMPA